MASRLLNMPNTEYEDMNEMQKQINKEINHYTIPSKPKNPTGKGMNAKVELIYTELYKQGARMVGFGVANNERVLNWIKTLSYRYNHQLASVNNFT